MGHPVNWNLNLDSSNCAVGLFFNHETHHGIMKILELDGHKYSKASFSDYKFRAKVLLVVNDDVEPVQMDIYTTDNDKENVVKVLSDNKSDKVTSITITYWCTRAEDDAAGEMINELLK